MNIDEIVDIVTGKIETEEENKVVKIVHETYHDIIYYKDGTTQTYYILD